MSPIPGLEGLSGISMRSWLIALGFVALLCAPAHAQVGNLPQINPGAIQNDIDRQQRQIEQQSETPKLRGPAVIGGEREKNPVLKPGGPKFKLRKIQFDPSKFISPEELDALAGKYVGKQVDIATLLQLVADVNAVYAERGIVTGIATLPEQSADGGLIHVKLTEGRLQNTTIQGNKQTSPDYVLQRVKEPAGEILDVPKLNRDVTWFNRTNDAQIKALLQPGSTFGLTDLQFAVIEPPVDTLQFFVDNQGVQTTGKLEQGVYYKRSGLFGVDDRLTFYGVRSDGNLNGNLAYNIPVNPWGGRIGVSYTQGAIKIIKGPFVGLDVTGKSNQYAINFSQPVVATDNWLLLLNAAQTVGNTLSDFAAVDVTKDHYNRTTGGFALTNSGKDYSINISPAFNVIQWHDHILGGAISFDTYTGTGAVLAKLPADFSINILSNWQYSPTHLLPGDQIFSIGGPTTVRGYPTNAVAGDSGYYFNAEMHHDWSALLKGVDTYIFSDYGAVYSTNPAVVELNSVGTGFSWTPHAALTFEGSYAVPLKFALPTQRHYELYGRFTFRPLLAL
jgi:hemolysin activation/secretion protein